MAEKVTIGNCELWHGDCREVLPLPTVRERKVCDERTQWASNGDQVMNDELKQLIEDAAKLLGIDRYFSNTFNWLARSGFNPLDPERGDLMKVVMAAELCIDGRENEYFVYYDDECIHEPAWFRYEKDDYDSLCYAILRAASAVLKAREVK